MSSRVDELHRQRALLQEHLAWLEREIAAEESGAPAAPAGSKPAPASMPLPVAPHRHPLPGAPATALTTATAADATVATTINVVAPAILPASTGSIAGPDAILDQYRQAPDILRNDIRKGCFLYFTLAFVLLGIGVGALYLLFRT